MAKKNAAATNRLNLKQRTHKVQGCKHLLALAQALQKSLQKPVANKVTFTQFVTRTIVKTVNDRLDLEQKAKSRQCCLLIRFAQSPTVGVFHVPGGFDVASSWVAWKTKFQRNNRSTWARDFLQYLIDECGCVPVTDSSRELILNYQA